MTDVGRNLVRRHFEELWNERKLDVCEELMAEDFTENAPAPFAPAAPGRGHGPSAMRKTVEWLVAQFPDIHMEIESIVAEGDIVAARIVSRGTHLGTVDGAPPPTGQSFAARQSHWFRIEDARLAEHWATRDDLSAMLQLGVLQPPGTSAKLSPTVRFAVMTRQHAVKTAIAAVHERDIDAYLACCTDRTQLYTPNSQFIGPYEGSAGIRRFFQDLDETSPDFRLELERLDLVADHVLALLHNYASGRASEVPVDTETAAIYDFADDRIERVRVFSDRPPGRPRGTRFARIAPSHRRCRMTLDALPLPRGRDSSPARRRASSCYRVLRRTR